MLIYIAKQIKHWFWLRNLDIEGWIDKYRINRDLKGFKNSHEYDEGLFPKVYNHYTTRVSHPQMAISYELSKFIYNITLYLNAKSILDLGSGYSTYVFAQYKKNQLARVKLWSIDDSSLWLSKTKSYLKKNDLLATRLMNWKAFKKVPTKNLSFDFILHDIGTIETRISLLQHILKFGKSGSIVVFDDMHVLQLNRAVKKAVKEKALNLYSLRSVTKDKFGRFSSLAKFR